MKGYFSKKRNGLNLMYIAALVFSLFTSLAIMVSEVAGMESFLLVILWGGLLVALTKFTGLKPLWGGVLAIILSLSFVFSGILGITSEYTSMEMLFTDLAKAFGGVLIFTGALMVMWNTPKVKALI